MTSRYISILNNTKITNYKVHQNQYLVIKFDHKKANKRKHITNELQPVQMKIYNQKI